VDNRLVIILMHIHTYVHTYTYIHTYIHTYTYIVCLRGMLDPMHVRECNYVIILVSSLSQTKLQ